jgi:hypothetical protein
VSTRVNGQPSRRESHGRLPAGFRRKVALGQWAAILVNFGMVAVDLALLDVDPIWFLPNSLAGAYCCAIRGATVGYWRLPWYRR